MDNILGIDLGSGSIGIALRDVNAGESMKEQLQYFSSDIFQSGVGMDKTGEYSFAAERTSNRQSRRLYDVRRRKLWATLSLLIDNDFCPMSRESLKRWSTYDKSKGLTRRYPIDDKAFENWIKLDFNGDGNPDFSSPYQLRRLLAEEQLDFSIPSNRYMLGRAIYHIAQHRGFKSSKGETIKETDNSKSGDEGLDVAQEMKKSETKLSKGLVSFMSEHSLKTVGQAFATLEDEGLRIRNNATYKAVRSQYVDEIKYIFDFQDGLDSESDFFKRLISTKKGEGTLFYKKPLKSQKGLVGKCTLEPNKTRCPISHPMYEIFKAWQIINNIKYKKAGNPDWQELTLDQKEDLFFNIFISRVKSNFKFEDIRKHIEKNILYAKIGTETGNIVNYKDTQSLDGCPITARLFRIFAPVWGIEKDEWHSTLWLINKLNEKVIAGNKTRTSHSKNDLSTHAVAYSAIDMWHICYTAEEPEDLQQASCKRLNLNEEESKELLRIWSAIAQGYGTLSLKAINNITHFLILGLKYNDAALLAKVPEIANVERARVIELLHDFNTEVRESVNYKTTVVGIVNNLIASYKALPHYEQFAYKNYDYVLDDKDNNNVVAAIESYVGSLTWGNMDADEQLSLINDVERGYQSFFADKTRAFLERPKVDEAFHKFLSKNFPAVNPKEWYKLYHHSDINPYPHQSDGGDRSQWRLGSPNIGSIRNPVVLRTLNMLRKKINAMLDAGMINYEDTRIVVETAREFNDANMRWAINAYQRLREDENNKIRTLLEEFVSAHGINRAIGSIEVNRARYGLEQGGEQILDGKTSETYNAVKSRDIKRYKLWSEQNCLCMYTGKPISVSMLFDENQVDIEHTIPRSLSFDSSDQNLTLCDSHYNRTIKRNRIPTQLPNYKQSATINGETYSPILPRLEAWKKRVERLKDNVEFWVAQSRRATTKERKDLCIRQRHLWRMEYNYWRHKLERFTMTEVKDGFKNSQLVDTRIITKYATLYLKSVFKYVSVQRGSDTAEFRKILGIETIEKKKDRSKHSHHAIDATVLTLIPFSARAKQMRTLFAKIEEAEKLGYDASAERSELFRLVKECNIGNDTNQIGDYIERTILINRHSRNKAMIPNKSNRRISLIVNGKKQKVSTGGDSIRGRLHKETFFAAVQLPAIEGNGLNREYANHNGKWVYPESEDKYMVTRKMLSEFSAEKELETIVDTTLRRKIAQIVKSRMANGMTFKEAVSQDLWMTDSKGNEVKKDRNGRPLSPIRHVRCLVKAGRGFMTFDKSLQIREHVQTSSKRLVNLANRDYKKMVYAQNDTNYVFLLYEGIKRGKIDRKSNIISLFDLSLNFKGEEIKDFFSFFNRIPRYATFNSKGVAYHLVAAITAGTKVLLWNEKPSELYDMIGNNEELSKRLYTVYKFNTTGADLLYLLPHNTDDQHFELKLVVNNFNCLIEHRDFEMDILGNITLYPTHD